MLQRDPQAQFYVLSRSGTNALQNPRVNNIAVDVTDADAVLAALPEQVDYIVDFVGHPAKYADESHRANDLPAQVMLQVAQAKNVRAMGFIGGTLGPKAFTDCKARLAKMLDNSGIRTVTVVAHASVRQRPQRQHEPPRATAEILHPVFQQIQTCARGRRVARNGGRTAQTMKRITVCADLAAPLPQVFDWFYHSEHFTASPMVFVSRWHTAAQHDTGAVRDIVMAAGWYREAITAVEPNRFIRYRVLRSFPRVKQKFTEIAFTPAPNGTTRVTWTVELQTVPALITPVGAKLAKLLYGTILRAGKRALERAA